MYCPNVESWVNWNRNSACFNKIHFLRVKKLVLPIEALVTSCNGHKSNENATRRDASYHYTAVWEGMEFVRYI